MLFGLGSVICTVSLAIQYFQKILYLIIILIALKDSEAEDNDETEEEFLNRYAKAAAALQSGVTIEEGDMDDEDHAIELGRSLPIVRWNAKIVILEENKLKFL